MLKLEAPFSLLVTAHLEKDELERLSLSKSEKKGFFIQFKGDRQESLEKKILTWLKSYLLKKPTKPSFLKKPKNFGSFSWKVLTELLDIPFGTHLTYKQVAERVNSPFAARAVGNACKQNPFPLIIPCHRVIKSDGTLCGFAFGLWMKELLLDFEQTIFDAD